MGAWIETNLLESPDAANLVAPRVGAWIETALANIGYIVGVAAPVGAWIEHQKSSRPCDYGARGKTQAGARKATLKTHTRVDLKQQFSNQAASRNSRAGAWIETIASNPASSGCVTQFAGAWIERQKRRLSALVTRRARGLKLGCLGLLSGVRPAGRVDKRVVGTVCIR